MKASTKDLPMDVKLAVKIDAELHERARVVASKTGRTVSGLARLAIRLFIEEEEKKDA